MDFLWVANKLLEISGTRATTIKESLLKEYGEKEEGLKEVLKFIYDPYFTTGLKQKKLDRAAMRVLYTEADEIMQYLKVNSTGSDYAAEVANGFILCSDDRAWQWLATGLVTKDLRIGVSVTTLNKVFGAGFIPIMGIMRGMSCPEATNGIYIATEKIDGNRRLIMNKHTGVEVYTRSGHRDMGLVEIAEQVAQQLPKGYVFDCECVAVGEFSDSIELRQASASILNKRTGTKTGVKALVFDMMSQAEYDAGLSKFSAVGRKAMLAGLFRNEVSYKVLMDYFMTYDDKTGRHVSNSISAVYNMFPVAYTSLIQDLTILGIAHTKQDGIDLAKPIWESGGEGVMLVDVFSPYEVNPNPRKTLLKIKASTEYILNCVGVYQGDAGKKYENSLGGIYVEYQATDGKSYVVGCGSGFPDYLREEYWNDPTKIVGKNVEIESFGESRNDSGNYSLNCAIFKRIVGDVD